tara:strand:+ start:1582 stop:2835 length:1254 start_codon:yes stop_codon:yes gene_type:complete
MAGEFGHGTTVSSDNKITKTEWEGTTLHRFNSAAAGDIGYDNGSSFVRLAKGTASTILCMNSGATAPEWFDGLTLSNDGTKTTILGKSGDYTRIGDAATTSHSLTSEDDLMVSGKLEVKGTAYFDGQINASPDAPLNYIRHHIDNVYTSGGGSVYAIGLLVDGGITAHSGDTSAVIAMQIATPITTPNASVTIGLLTQLYVAALNINIGSDTVTLAASLYVQGEPTQGTLRAAVYVVAGKVILASADPLQLGIAGTATGTMNIQGATSGVVTMTVAAVAGTWTMTLPAAVGGAGEQLTDAAGNGITSWAAAASLREYKNVLCEANPQDAIDAILDTKAYHFHYKECMGTLDMATEYVGVMADEAAWAMHYDGRIVNPVNTLGYMVLGFQATDARIESVEDKVERLEAEITELKAGLN